MDQPKQTFLRNDNFCFKFFLNDFFKAKDEGLRNTTQFDQIKLMKYLLVECRSVFIYRFVFISYRIEKLKFH